MEQRQRIFKFKKFTLAHGHSALPVGFDGVLLGAWADVSNATSILDAGTGCGLIALMCAQRNEKALIKAIDIHAGSIEEASRNFKVSPWNDRLTAELSDFNSMEKEGRGIDLIVSNPPFFNSGIKKADNARLSARHVGEFGPEALIEHGVELLSERGDIALICEADDERRLLNRANNFGLFPKRICLIASTPQCKSKRVLMQFSKQYCDCQRTWLYVRGSTGEFTPEYISMTKDFYLDMS